MKEQEQYVVCAANKLVDGTIILGVRHWDDFMHQAADDYLAARDKEDITACGNAEQGFIDQFGNFLTRKEAWDIAVNQNQIRRTGPGFSGPELNSENLY